MAWPVLDGRLHLKEALPQVLLKYGIMLLTATQFWIWTEHWLVNFPKTEDKHQSKQQSP